jgi:hypothetical protein
MVRKPCLVVFRSRELDDFLQVHDSKFRRWIDDMQAVLKENVFAGESISKKQIPIHYTERFGVNNLFRYAHPEGYRSCYTVFYEEGIGVCPHILDLLSHEEYDRIFGYRKR